MSNGPYIVDETCLVFVKNIEEENERLRAENEKLFNQAEMNARLLTENTDLRAELKLSEDMLRSQAKSIERLVSRIEYSEEAYVRLDTSMNRLKAAFRINMLRAFPSMSHEEIDAETAAAIRERSNGTI